MRRERKSRRPFVILLGGVALLLLVTGGFLSFLGGTNPLATRAIGGPFTLVDAEGRTVTDQSLRGRWLLIYFGYTQCRDVCPATLAAIGPALDALGERGARVQPVFITVDPQHDTPAVLRDYVANVSPRLIGLTGSPQALQAVRDEYRIEAVTQGGDIAHSSALLLVGPDGHFVAPIQAGLSATALESAIETALPKE